MELLAVPSYKSLYFSTCDPIIQNSSIDQEGPEPLKKDFWGFDFFWPEIVKEFGTVEALYGAIQDLYRYNQKIKEKFRSMALAFPDFECQINQNGGVSGSYFLADDTGKRHFVIKPLDEDAGCIHSRHWASPFVISPLRKYMPLYRSAMREALAYQVAYSIGVGTIVPQTTLGIFTSDQFHDFADGVNSMERHRYLEYCGNADREKLCSVQEYVHNSKSLFEAIHELEAAGLSDSEIAARFDSRDFEDANILLWTTYDTDGHMGNFLVYPKGVDEIGNEVLGLKKIDNGLAFPDKNRQLRNTLSYLPNAKNPLSAEGRAKIEAIDVDTLAKQFEQMGLESATAALRERIAFLKETVKTANITIREIDKQMNKMGKNK